MKIDLTNQNRYGETTYLEYFANDLWQLHTPYAYRVIYEPDNTTVFAIDPSGGPFLSVGSRIQNKKITAIFRSGLIELKNIDKMESIKYFYTPALQVRSFNLLCSGDGEVIESAPDFGGTYIKDLPRMVVCSIYDKEHKKMYFGTAVCSSKDNFCKKTAREMSYKRAKEKPIHTIDVDDLDNIADLSRTTVQLIMNAGQCLNL